MTSSSELAWQAVELQIEALIPGILLAVEGKAITYLYFDLAVSTLPWFPASDFVRGTTFIAGAYALGLFAAMLSRTLLDSVSEIGPRTRFLRLFAHGKLDDLEKHFLTIDSVRFRLDLGMKPEATQPEGKTRERWNAVYRSALRVTTRKSEVDRRRAQGRLIRNLFLPSVMAPWALTPPASSLGCHLLLSLAAGSVAFALYVYSEVVIFAEAHDLSNAPS